MSKSLNIDCEWLDQPLVKDPVERRTWACIRVSAASRAISRLWDRAAQGERVSIYIPAFPLADWLVENWWALLYEPSRSERIPTDQDDWSDTQADWLSRHCLRAADSGLLLPRACFFSDGRSTCIQWVADEQDAYPNMPGHFVESGLIRLPRAEVELSLREFVSKVLTRVESLDDGQVAQTRANWNSILSADASETAFCRSVGRMGLNPYRSHEWDSSLVTLLETGLGDDTERPIADDFLEAAQVAWAAEVWNWVRLAERELALGKSPEKGGRDQTLVSNAAAFGYLVAGQVRQSAALGSADPVDSIEAIADKIGVASFSFKERNDLPTSKVRAVVGWPHNQAAVMTGPMPSRPDSRRFLQARGLFHAAYNCGRGPRLITDAHTWDQQAARAFAAELLAPRKALALRMGSDVTTEIAENVIEQLAQEYKVSAMVVRFQQENANISSGTE